MKRCIAMFGFAIFMFAACSKEEISEVTGEDFSASDEVKDLAAFNKSNELLASNFLPTFTNFYGRDGGTSTNRSSSLASEWIHEYDENGTLLKSSFFELHPHRILREIRYLDVEDDKLKFEIKQYSYYGLIRSYTDSLELEFDKDMYIKELGPGEVFTDLNEEGWVTRINTITPDGHVVYRTGYEYDEKGNVLRYRSYDISGTNYANVDYSYNENGDPLSYHFQDIYGSEIKVDYYYRGDNTLERLEEAYYHDDEDFGTQIFTYTPDERFLNKVTNRGDGTREIVSYSEDEIVVECYKDDVLTEVTIYQIQEDGYTKKVQKEFLDGILHKIKYYNAEGELEYTEYYDENGDLTETVYE